MTSLATSGAASNAPEEWSQPEYVHREIERIQDALTRVLFGDYSVVVQTDAAAPVWGNLAMHVNVVINAARNGIARAERERRRLEALYELTRTLTTATDGDELLNLAVETVSRLLELSVAAVRLVEDEDLVLRAATGAWTSARPRIKVGESISGRVIEANTALVVDDVLSDPRFDSLHRRAAAKNGLAAFLGAPIKDPAGRPLGVLFGYRTAASPFDADDVSLLSAFADQISVSLEKQRLAADRRRAEEAARQSEKLASMGQLLAGVAHELNNPLSVVVGYAEIIRGRLTDPSLKDAAERVETAANRCARIVRNFLALAQKHPPERAWLALDDLVKESIELVAYGLRVDGVDVHIDVAPNLPRLRADRHQIQQVIVNLITNAHHAMRESNVRRLVIETRHDVERARIALRISDSGPGVPDALRGRIFEPFFTTKPVGQGTGLGLALCQSIIEAHGGSLTLVRTAEPGATFTIELPMEREEGTVLVVDDEPSIVDMLGDILSAEGYRVDTASTGAAALEKLASETYNVVLSDVRMPDLDGIELYLEAPHRCRGMRPPFIFMTGDVLTGSTRSFLDGTAAVCLPKPFSIADVRRVLAETERKARLS